MPAQKSGFKIKLLIHIQVNINWAISPITKWVLPIIDPDKNSKVLEESTSYDLSAGKNMKRSRDVVIYVLILFEVDKVGLS